MLGEHVVGMEDAVGLEPAFGDHALSLAERSGSTPV